MKDAAIDVPDGWIEQCKKSGRFIFLIDGLDEISEPDREKIITWLEELDLDGKCIKVVTARPQVKERPVYVEFLELKILSMGREKIRNFIGYWMMKNNHVEITMKEAVKVAKRSINGMNVLESANAEQVIFKHLLERYGILRETERGKIDFIHRTFQEYLTAYEISRQEDWGYIQEKIGNTVWQETIVMCIGYAKRKMASKLIRYTLKRAEANGINRRYLFIAISYLNGAVEVDRELRIEIEERYLS